ncbi:MULTISPECIES: fructosamine kinase family protein [Nitrosomonas]|uniref:Fructosamine-3-kinase n=2 Tax=Nitrosomonas communis TaxID=44574 RepID=A0A5D3YE51_9PROT|nr:MULTISPECIES: fructosamine kinase family protein [Nitrosomonas]TYP86983.1 fructosamine-3-kinase [Nitrosomonas communis]UVS62228.1 fructosamine kinase family protein [Nitrosomonas sp. PLL12]
MMRSTHNLSSQSPWPEIAEQIESTLDTHFVIEKIHAIGGGCINETYHLQGREQHYFVKLNKASTLPMFEAEAAGLKEIHNSHTLRVPEPKCWGSNEVHAWLVLEYLELKHLPNPHAEALGVGLANMHRTFSDQFGWFRNNTIGSTLQKNDRSSEWIPFWRQHRLGYQLQLAQINGYKGRLQTQGERLMADLDVFFTGTRINACLLHGDLWSGNYSFDAAGRPVLFDPAVYYGDRETDLAMTELFGGFPAQFYASYQDAYPLEAGYHTRKTLYNLYHVLNHLNLFGSGYLRQAEQMMDKLLAEIK